MTDVVIGVLIGGITVALLARWFFGKLAFQDRQVAAYLEALKMERLECERAYARKIEDDLLRLELADIFREIEGHNG